jgi:hypothetical protein
MERSAWKVFSIAALSGAACLLPACALFEDDEPIPFEISKVVLPKDIPPPSSENRAYPEPGKPEPAEKSAKSGAGPAVKATPPPSEAGKPRPAERPTAPAKDLVKVKMPTSDEGSFLTPKSFVTRWNILGPIPARGGAPSDPADNPLQFEYVQGEKLIDGSRDAPEGARWNVKIFNTKDAPGVIDMGSVFHSQASKSEVYYASACLDCPEDVEGASLLVASTIPLKIWLNGVLVHCYDKGPRELKLDQDLIEGVFLKEGYNRLVVKLLDPTGSSDPKFMLRFATPAGQPISTTP